MVPTFIREIRWTTSAKWGISQSPGDYEPIDVGDHVLAYNLESPPISISTPRDALILGFVAVTPESAVQKCIKPGTKWVVSLALVNASPDHVPVLSIFTNVPFAGDVLDKTIGCWGYAEDS